MARAGDRFFEPWPVSHSVQVGHQLPSWRVAVPSQSLALGRLLVVGPEAMLVGGGRVDHPGIVAGAAEDEVGADVAGAAIDRFPGRDMVVLQRDHQHRRRDRGEVDRHAADLEAGRLLQLVVEQQVAVVALEEGRRDARAILEPVEQVARRRRLVEQIMVHHRRPDEVVGAHRREQPLQLQAVDEALAFEMILERGEMAFVDEGRPVAHVGEVDQAADQRRAN